MKVGDWVVRLPERQKSVVWTAIMKDRATLPNQVTWVSTTGTSIRLDGSQSSWDKNYFEPSDREMFNNLIDAYYDEGSKD